MRYLVQTPTGVQAMHTQDLGALEWESRQECSKCDEGFMDGKMPRGGYTIYTCDYCGFQYDEIINCASDILNDGDITKQHGRIE